MCTIGRELLCHDVDDAFEDADNQESLMLIVANDRPLWKYWTASKPIWGPTNVLPKTSRR